MDPTGFEPVSLGANANMLANYTTGPGYHTQSYYNTKKTPLKESFLLAPNLVHGAWTLALLNIIAYLIYLSIATF